MRYGEYVQYTDEEQKVIFGSTGTEIGFSFPISVNLAMGDGQAERLGRDGMVCIRPDLPNSRDVYFMLNKLPKDKVVFVESSWGTEIEIRREHIVDIMGMLYPNGLDDRYWQIISAIEGDVIRLIGFAD